MSEILLWDIQNNFKAPFSWNKPQRAKAYQDIFTWDDGDRIKARLGIMAAHPQHQFLLRTRHLAAARDFLREMVREASLSAFPTCEEPSSERPADHFIREQISFDIAGEASWCLYDGSEEDQDHWYHRLLDKMQSCPWPLPNVRIEGPEEVLWPGNWKSRTKRSK